VDSFQVIEHVQEIPVNLSVLHSSKFLPTTVTTYSPTTSSIAHINTQQNIVPNLPLPNMASSSYTAVDQAADLGIHRVHSLVLGDPRKEARIAARYSPPQLKRSILGKGDVRIEEHQCNRERRRELETIARRNNLKTYFPLPSDESTLVIFCLFCC
jgi:hypothetical protein